MRILYYFAQFDGPMYHWQDNHIIDELAHHNISVEIFNPLHFSSVNEANEKVIAYIKDNRPDMFLTCNNEEYIYPDTIKAVKTLSVPTVLYCFDSLMTPLSHAKIAGLFDLVMISQNDVNGVFKGYNKNTIVSHYAANPFFFQKSGERPQINRIAFVGTPYGSRADVINELLKGGIDVDLFCNTGRNTKTAADKANSNSAAGSTAKTVKNLLKSGSGRKVLLAALKTKIIKPADIDFSSEHLERYGAVDLKTTNSIYASRFLSLSISTARNTGVLKNPIDIVHLRNFEIPMCGGVQFCKYFPELADQFEEGKEIIFYRSNEEMVDKARYYLDTSHSRELYEISDNARERAEKDHTWYRRFSAAFENLGLKHN